MSNPMVGDIVSYHPGPTHPLAGRYGDSPLAAIVVSVSDDGNVNLCIFDPDGAVSHSAGVRPRQEGKKHHGGSFEVRGAAKPVVKPTPPVTPYQEGVQVRRDQQTTGMTPIQSYPPATPLGSVQGQTNHPTANPPVPRDQG